jgi:hypothetical protein
MTIDEDSRNPKSDPQHHAQGAIHSPYIQKRRHIGSGVQRFIQNRRSVQLAWPKMGQINFPRKQQITAISSLHLSDRTECSGITNHVTLTENLSMSDSSCPLAQASSCDMEVRGSGSSVISCRKGRPAGGRRNL